MTTTDDFLTPEARRVLDALGNSGAIIEWRALGDLTGNAVMPDLIDPAMASEHTVIAVWPDESASLVTVKPFEGNITPIPSS